MRFGTRKGHRDLGTKRWKIRQKKNPNGSRKTGADGSNQTKPGRGKRKQAKKRTAITAATYPMLHGRRRRERRRPDRGEAGAEQAAPGRRGGGSGWNLGVGRGERRKL